MGVVYRARDTLMDREVALKTILDIDNPLTLDLFYKECGILAGMVHPNIINVYDVGEFDDNGVKKPFFVMPLLPGSTLDKLIKDSHPRATIENLVEILTQACRGLQAAHEMGLVHRDIKPSNIFVLDDNAVKIIDFGVARAASVGSMTALKGTLAYMAPEQLRYKPPTPLSDQYSLAMVAYECLARRRPFQAASESEMVDAILHHTPPPVSDLNPNIRYAISQVIHKALAKQPLNRFSSVREFGEALNKALRSESLQYFDPGKIKPRLERATASFEQGDFEFASEVLAELEAEGFLDPNISLLRRRLDQAMRQSRVRQLLDSAHRYLKAQEYPLALRKLQEAIEIDPEHPDVLALKNRAEKERRERKVDEWIQLARQHIQNQSFAQAREALENLLKLKPNDTEALKMISEISQREHDITEAREKKHQLYESALQAWDRGDLTSALGRMDALVSIEQQAPETDSGRSGTYRSFYNQVRSEHDNLKHSYDEARHRLEADDFDGALALCKQCLVKYPNHALFQSLQFDIEERRRQKLSSFIAEIDRRVDQEPDLNVRVATLENAAAQYPEEKHFQSSLRLVRDKRDLVASIVSKAQMYEERQQFNEALDQWQILKSIHAGYPGLNFEIERLTKRRDAEARQSEKAHRVEQIDRCLELGEYDRAMHTLQGALAEFPGDPEFPELEKLVRQGQERTAQALELLNQAREAGDAGRPEETPPLLRRAYEIDSRNAVVRAVLINTLLEQAGELMNRDWKSAEPLLREVLEIEPNHAGAQSLLNQMGDRRREEYVTSCVTRARRLQIDGDLEGALTLVRSGLENYPQERLLQQLQATLLRSQTASDAGKSPAPPAPAPPPGPEVDHEAETIALNPAIKSEPPKPQPNPPAELDVTATIVAPPTAQPPSVPSESTPKPPQSAAPIPPPTPAPAAPAPAAAKPPQPARRSNKLVPISIAAAAVVVMAAGGFLAMRLRQQPAPPPPVRQTQAPAPVETPRLPAIVIATNFPQATVSVDDGAEQPVQNGEAQLTELPAGQRNIRFKGEGSQAVIPVTIVPGAAPQVNLPIQQTNVGATIVTGLGATARVYTTLQNGEASLDGKPIGKLEATGLDLQNLAPGSHELVVKVAQGSSHRVVFDSSPIPSMNVFLGTERNVGSLRVTTGEDEVAVYIDGVKTRRGTQRGRLILYLAPKTYRIRVEKDGFQPAAEQTIEVRKGEEARLEFSLVRLPEVGTVLITKAPTGAEVSIDNNAAGTTHPDGTFSISNLKPGTHTVTIKKESFKPLTREINVVAGQQVEVDGALQQATGTLRVATNPPDANATLAWKREGEDIATPFSGPSITLPEGSYIVTGKAPDYDDARTVVRITSGREVTATLVFRKTAKKVSAEVPRGATLADVEKAGGWTREGNVLVRTGGNLVVLPVGGSAGAYSFNAMMPKGKRVDWVVAYVDPKNYVSYELNDDRLERVEYIDGKKQATVKPKLRVRLDRWIQISIEVTPNSITTSVQQEANNFPALDRLTSQQTNFARGRFGFRIPNKDRLAVGNFAFIGK
jgi:serine/threonine-protein kinase